MRSRLSDIINVLYPKVCHICGNHLSPHEEFICLPCISNLPRTGYHRNHKNPMVERFAGHFPFKEATGHFFYSKDSSLAALIQDMKYRNFPSIGEKLGEIAAKELMVTGFLNDIDYIVPLPMHFFKKALRGYNQTDYISKGISSIIMKPVSHSLRMTRRRKTQTSLSQKQRLANANDLFSCCGKIDLNGKGVLLVDDICTTGATLDSAAMTLTRAFPDIKLYLFTLGVTF